MHCVSPYCISIKCTVCHHISIKQKAVEYALCHHISIKQKAVEYALCVTIYLDHLSLQWSHSLVMTCSITQQNAE